MQNCLLVITISFLKTGYSKQLIFAKQLITISFLKNNFFKIAYLCKTAYYDLIFKKQLIYAKQLITISFLKNNFFKKHCECFRPRSQSCEYESLQVVYFNCGKYGNKNAFV